jgi:hypothetical protein
MSSADASSHPYTLARAKYGKIPFMKRIYAKQDEQVNSTCRPMPWDVEDFALMVSAGVNYIEEQQELLDKAMESGQELKNKLLEAQQENIALKLRVAKLEEDVKKAEAEYDAKLLFEISRNRQLKTQNCLLSQAINKVEEPLHLKLKCVEGERDEYKYQLKKAERENKRLTMLLEEAERNCFSDSD